MRVRCADADLPPVARKPSQILALLLLNHARVVPTAALMDELWPGSAPKTARAATQTYIVALRKKFAAASGLSMDAVSNEILRTARGGYEFVAEPAWFDLRSFRQREQTGLAAMADGDVVKAVQDFRAALSLWSGPPLAGVQPGPGIRAELAGIEQSRATIVGHRVELELRFGRHREILDELTNLVSQDRFNEDLQAQFILALYRSGYRSRALEAFHRLRKDMIGSFGLEPSPKLHRYYQAVLNSDPVLVRTTTLALPRQKAVLPR